MTQYNIITVAMDISICSLYPNLQISGNNSTYYQSEINYVGGKLCDVVSNNDGTYNIKDGNSMYFYYSEQQFDCSSYIDNFVGNIVYNACLDLKIINCTNNYYPFCDTDSKILEIQKLVKIKQGDLANFKQSIEGHGCVFLNGISICMVFQRISEKYIEMYQNLIDHLEKSKVLKIHLVNYDLYHYSIQHRDSGKYLTFNSDEDNDVLKAEFSDGEVSNYSLFQIEDESGNCPTPTPTTTTFSTITTTTTTPPTITTTTTTTTTTTPPTITTTTTATTLNQAPIAQQLPIIIKKGQEVIVNFMAYDPEGDTINYIGFNHSYPWAMDFKLNGEVTIKPDQTVELGIYTIYVTAKDIYNNTAEQESSIIINVIDSLETNTAASSYSFVLSGLAAVIPMLLEYEI